MSTTPFYGREEELSRLKQLFKKKTSSLVVIKGRRRIGKSRLIFEFCQETTSYFFTGLPPEEGTTAQMQRDYFAKQMEQLLGIGGLKADDFADLLFHLAQKVQHGRVVLVLDEINWMGNQDPTFLGKLKSAWDLYFKNNPKLILILSGSMSRWIEKNILSSTGFMGRVSLDLTLDELPLPVCNRFWRKKADRISAFEKFKILSVTGGVPRYLEEIDPDLSAEENILSLGFTKGGLLVNEFDRIFSDLFSNRSYRYKLIVQRLAQGSADFDELCEAVEMEKGGTVSEYLEDLIETGYVSRDFTWNIKDGKESKLSKYRLKDNYLRFYLKYIEPKRSQIEKHRIKTPPSWSTIMGFQFENLVMNNFQCLYRSLSIDPSEVIFDNPYFQKPTKSHPGCQIDYLIQVKFNTLYLCEIKFSQEKIGPSVIREVKQKIKRLRAAKSFSIRPCLIHVNGVHDAVVEADFFSNIIDFGDFLYP